MVSHRSLPSRRLLLIVTLFSYALAGSGALSRLLFWLGLGGENNIGAWWSGMLLVLAAFFAFDGFFNPDKPLGERRGWLALGFALLFLSFDEIASLHESLSRVSLGSLAVVGASRSRIDGLRNDATAPRQGACARATAAGA